MPTEAELSAALINAHNAGDEPAARTLATAIQNMRASASLAAQGTSDEPLDEIAHAASPAAIARASLAPDPQFQIKRYAESFKQPEEDFGIVGGHIVRRIPETGQYARVEPSVAGATGPIDAAKRAFDWVASGAGPAIPAVTSGLGAVMGTIAGLETGPGALAAGMAGGAAGGAAGEVARQKLDAALAKHGEEAPLDLENVAWQAAAGAGGPVIGKGIEVAGNRIAPVLAQAAADELPESAVAARTALTGNSAPIGAAANSFGLSPRVVNALKEHISGKEAELAQLRQDAQSLGIDLSLGQLTGSEAVKQSERQLLRQPETVQKVVDLRNAQNSTQIPDAVKSVLDEVAPDAPASAQVANFRQAAEDVTKKAWKDLSAEARPAYASALDDKEPFINDSLQELLNRPTMKAAWKEAQKNAADEGRVLPQLFTEGANGELTLDTKVVPDWRAWQDIKGGLRDIIDSNMENGHLTPDGRRALNLKNEMMGVLYKENPEWAAADAKYGSDRDAVDAILGGGVGLVNKMSGPDRQNMVNTIFSGKSLMPDDVATMRRQFIYAGKTADWNGGIRSYIADKLADAVAPLKRGGDPDNVAGALYKSLFEERQADVIKAALGGAADDTTIARWNKLGRVLKAASNQLPEGSPTATDTGAPGLVSRAVQGVKYMLHPTSMGADLIDGLTKLQDPAMARKLADTLMTPEGDKLLKSLYPTTPGTAKANSILGTILIQAGIVEAEDRASR